MLFFALVVLTGCPEMGLGGKWVYSGDESDGLQSGYVFAGDWVTMFSESESTDPFNSGDDSIVIKYRSESRGSFAVDKSTTPMRIYMSFESLSINYTVKSGTLSPVQREELDSRARKTEKAFDLVGGASVKAGYKVEGDTMTLKQGSTGVSYWSIAQNENEGYPEDLEDGSTLKKVGLF
jgi:hypothetical protein